MQIRRLVVPAFAASMCRDGVRRRFHLGGAHDHVDRQELDVATDDGAHGRQRCRLSAGDGIGAHRRDGGRSPGKLQNAWAMAATAAASAAR